MRCLNCRLDGIHTSTEICPQCGVHLPSLMRDILPRNTLLQNGNYQIDYPLGRGGFGITYQAIHSSLKKTVAIKEFYPQEHALRNNSNGELIVPITKQEIYQRGIDRFLCEGQTLARLNHSNVVRVENFFDEVQHI
jgi:serine/threonine protein kinase